MEESENEEFREFDISATNSKVYFCPHCERDLGKTAFFRHKRLYYNKRKRQWLKKPDTNRANDSSVKRIQVNLDDYPAADLTSMSNRKYIYIIRCSHVSLGELITPLDLIDKTNPTNEDEVNSPSSPISQSDDPEYDTSDSDSDNEVIFYCYSSVWQ